MKTASDVIWISKSRNEVKKTTDVADSHAWQMANIIIIENPLLQLVCIEKCIFDEEMLIGLTIVNNC